MGPRETFSKMFLLLPSDERRMAHSGGPSTRPERSGSAWAHFFWDRPTMLVPEATVRRCNAAVFYGMKERPVHVEHICGTPGSSVMEVCPCHRHPLAARTQRGDGSGTPTTGCTR